MRCKSNQCAQNKGSSGMTLVEVVVFMALTVTLMASTSTVIMQLLHSEKSHEQKLIIFNYNRSYLEQLRTVEYSSLTNGFNSIGNDFVKTTDQTFLGDAAKHKVTLTPLTSAEFGDHTRAASSIEWNTALYGRTSAHKEESVIFLYPHQ